MLSLIFSLIVLILSVLTSFATPTNNTKHNYVNASAFENLSSALTSPKTVGKTIIINSTMLINNKTLRPDRNIQFIRGGSIKPARGKTFNYNGQTPETGLFQIHEGDGTITGLKKVRPEWWGGGTSGLIKAIESAGNSGTLTHPSTVSMDGFSVKTTAPISLKSNIIIDGGTLSGHGFVTSKEMVSNCYINKVIFLNIISNAISITNKSHNITIDGCSFKTIGISNTLKVPSEGFGVYVSGASNVTVKNCLMTDIRGQAGVGFMYSRKCAAINNKIYNVYYRGIETYGTTTDSAFSLGHIIENNVIYDTGKNNPNLSAVGQNGVFVVGRSIAGNLISDHYVRYNTIYRVGENGVEGHGTFNNNSIDGTNYFGKSTPSKEGAWLTTSSYFKDNSISNTVGDGIKTSTSRNNIQIIDNVVKNYGGYGVYSNYYLATNVKLNRFIISGNKIYAAHNSAAAQDKSSDGYYVRDSSSGITTYDDTCYFLNNYSDLTPYNYTPINFMKNK